MGVQAQVNVTRPVAHARNRDPRTSHDAAKTVTASKTSRMRAAIAKLLHHYGPMTDEVLLRRYAELVSKNPTAGLNASDSSVRTRRSELVEMGIVRDSGRRDLTSSGSLATVWSLS